MIPVFCCKVHESGHDKILAVCDAQLIGKTFTEGDVEVHISPSFYGDEKSSAGSVMRLARKATIINAFGNDIIKLLIKGKIVEKSSVLKIGNIMHAQVVSFI